MKVWPSQRAYRPIRLGDKIERLLSERGITKEWYCSIKEEFGLPPICDCDKRIEWLNKVSEWLSYES